MKRLFIGVILLALLFACISMANATPILISDVNPELSDDAVFQLIINDNYQRDEFNNDVVFPVTPEKNIEVDVQTWQAGITKIQARFGEPWPDVPGAYRFSDPSDPLVYPFPEKRGAPTGLRIQAKAQ